jgi:hypothetical protein
MCYVGEKPERADTFVTDTVKVLTFRGSTFNQQQTKGNE